MQAIDTFRECQQADQDATHLVCKQDYTHKHAQTHTCTHTHTHTHALTDGILLLPGKSSRPDLDTNSFISTSRTLTWVTGTHGFSNWWKSMYRTTHPTRPSASCVVACVRVCVRVCACLCMRACNLACIQVCNARLALTLSYDQTVSSLG